MRILLMAMMMLMALIAKAQYSENLMFGLKAGAERCQMTGLSNMMITEENRPLYTLSDEIVYVPSVSLFAHYHFSESQIALEGVIGYRQTSAEAQRASDFDTESFVARLHHVTAGVNFRFYVIKGLNVAIGMEAGPCINGTTIMEYNSQSCSNSQLMQRREHIRECIKGRHTALADVVLGYELPIGFSVEAIYRKGLTDLIETGVNNYGFTECSNRSSYIGVSIGWAIGVKGFLQK